MYFARADYVQKNGATVESVLEAILRAHRNAEERPASVKENALRLLPETKPELVEATAATYKELRIWDVNGGAEQRTRRSEHQILRGIRPAQERRRKLSSKPSTPGRWTK